MSNETDNPTPPEPEAKVPDAKTPSPVKPKKAPRWKDWLLIFVAVVTLANGALEIKDMQRLNDIARQQTAISQQREPRSHSPEQQSKRELFLSTEGQVTVIKEFMIRNHDEITTVDHYDRQLTSLSQTAIDIAHETISKRNADDALTKAIKRKIELLESLLAQKAQTGQKGKFVEVYELAEHTQGLLKLCGPFMAETRRSKPRAEETDLRNGALTHCDLLFRRLDKTTMTTSLRA